MHGSSQEPTTPEATAPAADGWRPRLRALWDSPRLPAVLIGLGIALRLVQYASRRSLWIDEAWLALNIINRSWGRLLLPLDFCQGSPIGFVLLAKAAVVAFGTGELALRLVPFLAGAFSVYAFWLLARGWLGRNAAIPALALFALLRFPVYYAAEVKPYSLDVLWTVVLYLLFTPVLNGETGLRRLLPLAAAGVVAVWFSYPASFVLPGAGMTLAVVLLLRRQWAGLARAAVMGGAWAVSFAACYLVNLRQLATNPSQQDFWQHAFVPLDSLGGTAGWLRKAFMGLFQRTLGLPTSAGAAVVAALLFAVGFGVMLRTDRRKLAALVAPGMLCFLAATLRMYPFRGRLLLFLVPGMLILIGAGAARIAAARSHRAMRLVGPLLLVMLFVPTAGSALAAALPPYGHEEIRPVIEHMREHRQPGDLVYVHWGAYPAFEYYRQTRGYDFELWEKGICSPRNPSAYVQQLQEAVTAHDVRRVWFLISHDRAHERAFFESALEEMGARHHRFRAEGASAYLFELDRTAP